MNKAGRHMGQQMVLHGDLVLPEGIIPEGELIIEGSRIQEVNLRATRSDPTHAWHSGWIFPGLIDLHIHGAAGYDFMDASVEAFEAIDGTLARLGCTGYLATTLSASFGALQRVLQAARQYGDHAVNSGMLGVHLEGPFIHPQRIGAQRADFVRPPSLSELESYRRILGPLLKRITLAPEIPKAQDLIDFCRRTGIGVSAGHSNATFDEARTAFGAGVHQVTHLFNGMTGLHHRDPGLAAAALTHPEVWVELIADGVHVHREMIRLVGQLKGPNHTILVTDAMRATELGDGMFDLGGQSVQVKDGQARLGDGSLAGSTLSLMRAVFNYQAFAMVDLYEAVRAASLTPARVLGLADRGALEPGFWADVLFVDIAGRNRMTWRNGQIIFDGR